MPHCPHCSKRIKGDFISTEAASDIIAQRDLLKVQKGDLEAKVERQAAWITSLERSREHLKKENAVLRQRLGQQDGQTYFERRRG